MLFSAQFYHWLAQRTFRPFIIIIIIISNSCSTNIIISSSITIILFVFTSILLVGFP